ncbi:butyrophilin subfamily 1 member A1-like [Pagrus major]|uniref:butyrophilin subfamily 1 member A1-like n=1 Tax=Pagrus major TaxID=143350 RepID=UPI003CC89BF9
MSLVTSATLRLLLTSAWVIVACGDTQVKVKPGDDATLQCRAHSDDSIEKLEWSKTDLEPDNYVFFFRENRSYEDYQLPSFRGRVELLDPQMKEGDATVVLKKVTANDSGPYECLVFMSSGGGGGGGGGHTEGAASFRHIVHLKVDDSGEFVDSDQRFVFYTDGDS